MRGKVVALLCGLVAITFAPPARAVDPNTDGWEFKAAPYIWAVSLDGDMTVKGNTIAVDVNIIDIIKESDSIFALEGYFEARKGHWGGFIDGTYAVLTMGGSVGPLSADVDFAYALVDFAAFYQVGTWPLGGASANNSQNLSLEVLAGGRYTSMDVELDISTPGPSTVVDKRQDWVDPIVGARVFLDLSENFSFVVRGDIGGFGVGSDLTWNVAGLLFYDFDLFGRDASVVAGYRVLDQDFEDGSGANKFAYDVTTHGPILGMVIRF
jgi:hypothetical protein